MASPDAKLAPERRRERFSGGAPRSAPSWLGAGVRLADEPPRPPLFYFSVGEPSGDLHAANLIDQLRRIYPQAQFVGYGGPNMAAAGCRLHHDTTRLAVMWFLRAILNVHRFLALAARADRFFRHQRPDAVVLVDFPGFNWWIARRAKAHGIPVFYYTPPQIWAWASWRVRKMRRLVDHVLCSLPFEEEWFRSRGCRATFVGHPFFDEVRLHPLDRAFVARYGDSSRPLVTILPGSRTQEVSQNLRWFLKAARQIAAAVPQVRLAIACFRPEHAVMARRALAAAGVAADVFVRKTPELMHLATCCLAVSGSVSLELLYHRKPTVILYSISPLAYWVQTWFRRTKYITLVNLLAADEVFPDDLAPYDPAQPDAARVPYPEYLTYQDKSSILSGHVIQWLTDAGARAARVAQLDALAERVGHGGASSRAARYIADVLDRRPRLVPRPHFQPAGQATARAGGA